MSTLEVSEIIATGETAGRAVSGIAAAWVNFDGTGTIAVRDSVNVASLTDNGTGQYGINFISSFSNSSYSALSNAENDTIVGHVGTWNATNWAIATRNSSTNSLEDEQFASVSIHGDLA